MRVPFIAGLGLLFAAVVSGPVQAQGGTVVVPLGKMEILKLPRDAANVVLGDPSIANVTVEDPRTLFLFGRRAGETNLVIFDANRKPILNSALSVRGGTGSVTVYVPAAPGAGMSGNVWNCSGSNCGMVGPGVSAPAADTAAPVAPPAETDEGAVTTDTPLTQ